MSAVATVDEGFDAIDGISGCRSRNADVQACPASYGRPPSWCPTAASPLVAVAPVTAAVARQYGRVYAALRSAGTPIPVNDMWIAARAIDQGACLLTFDTDFERVGGLVRIVLDGIEPSAHS